MTSATTSVAANSPPPRRQRPPPGPPAEVWFWRILREKGRGEHRILADNVQYDGWQNIWTRRPPAPGRYRMEYRDARRAIVRVEYVNVPDPRSGEKPYFTEGRARRPQRKIPPASPAWEPKAPPPAPPSNRSTPARSTQPGRTATATSAATYLPLRSPGPAPEGMIWRFRRNHTWQSLDRNLAIPEHYYRLWLATSREVVLVYSETGTWPGYVPGQLKGGVPCLFPQATRS